jgi:outer membrane protein OmpA-like peptidoglycan-associated protein
MNSRIAPRSSFAAALAGALTLTGASCAHAPPRELLQARDTYHQASNGVASEQVPAQLHAADNALQTAEQSFAEHGDTEHTRDLSYIAMRKAQLAVVQGRTRANQVKLEALQSTHQQQQSAALETLRDKYASQQQQLDQSQAALEEAQRRAEQATADLQRIASVKQDPRGTVITLSGELLFRSDKAELLPGAEEKLDQVARALTQQDRNARIVVEGHTDSRGSDVYNLDLSTQRAQTVRDYLSAHGVAADRIEAKGLGEAQPIGNNSTPEGRANNRRVEIVVEPAKQANTAG